ncbi:hypothetical protein, partial [Streptomyces sp. NPDC056304]
CTAGCTAQKFDLFQLATAWSPSQSGKELLAAASVDSYTSGEELTATELGPVVQSWAELGDNTGLLLRAAGEAPGAAYYSASAGEAAAAHHPVRPAVRSGTGRGHRRQRRRQGAAGPVEPAAQRWGRW